MRETSPEPLGRREKRTRPSCLSPFLSLSLSLSLSICINRYDFQATLALPDFELAYVYKSPPAPWCDLEFRWVLRVRRRRASFDLSIFLQIEMSGNFRFRGTQSTSLALDRDTQAATDRAVSSLRLRRTRLRGRVRGVGATLGRLPLRRGRALRLESRRAVAKAFAQPPRVGPHSGAARAPRGARLRRRGVAPLRRRAAPRHTAALQHTQCVLLNARPLPKARPAGSVVGEKEEEKKVSKASHARSLSLSLFQECFFAARKTGSRSGCRRRGSPRPTRPRATAAKTGNVPCSKRCAFRSTRRRAARRRVIFKKYIFKRERNAFQSFGRSVQVYLVERARPRLRRN